MSRTTVDDTVKKSNLYGQSFRIKTHQTREDNNIILYEFVGVFRRFFYPRSLRGIGE